MGYQEHVLLDSRQDAVYESIEAMDFDPNDFTWSRTYGQVYGGSVPTLIYKPRGFEFFFDFDPQQHRQTTPNLWAMLDKQRELLAATEPTGETSDTPFSPDEQAQIAAQLNEIKELLVQTHGADRRALEGRVESLVDASTRLGRRDWLTILLGTMFTWTLEGLVPPEGLREALTIAARGLGHLFGGGVPRLPLA